MGVLFINLHLITLRQGLSPGMSPPAPHVSITLYSTGLLVYAPTPGFYKDAEDLSACPYAWAVSDLTL